MNLPKDVLLQIFFGMTRSRHERVYFDSRTLDVLTLVDGYLSSNLGNQTLSNRLLARRILSGDRPDDENREGLYLIPRLELNSYLVAFSKRSLGNSGMQRFVRQFRRALINNCPSDIDYEDLCITWNIYKDFCEELEQVSFEQTNEDSYFVWESTITEISRQWLLKIAGKSSRYFEDDDVFVTEGPTPDLWDEAKAPLDVDIVSDKTDIKTHEAFVTLSNLKSVVRLVDIVSIQLKEEIYHKQIECFNARERNRLMALKLLFRHPEAFMKEVYKPFFRQDSLRFIRKEAAPAYHTFEDCSSLHSDFSGLLIPKEIRSRGPENVQRFRDWYNSHPELHDRPQALAARMQIAFRTTSLPMAVSHKNTGITNLGHSDFSTLEENIDAILNAIDQFKAISGRNSVIINKYGKDSYAILSGKVPENDTAYSDTEIRSVLRKFDEELKRPLERLLVEYYRIRNNPQLKLKKNILSQLGFKYCSNCNNRRGT